MHVQKSLSAIWNPPVLRLRTPGVCADYIPRQANWLQSPGNRLGKITKGRVNMTQLIQKCSRMLFGMNRLALFVLAGSSVIHAQSTPPLVQVVNQSLLPNNTSCNGSQCFISAGGTYSLNLPNGTQAGNAMIL